MLGFVILIFKWAFSFNLNFLRKEQRSSPGFPLSPVFEVTKRKSWGLKKLGKLGRYDAQSNLSNILGLDHGFCGLFSSCLLPHHVKRELIFEKAQIYAHYYLGFYTILYWQVYHFLCVL